MENIKMERYIKNGKIDFDKYLDEYISKDTLKYMCNIKNSTGILSS